MSLTLIIIFGIEDRFSADEWVSSILFIFAFPIWVITKIIFKIKSIIAEIKRRKRLKELQDENNFTEILMLNEELKTCPFGDIWEHYCRTQNVPTNEKWFDEVKLYEKEVLSKRG